VKRRGRAATWVWALGVVLASRAGAQPDLVLERADWTAFQPISVADLLERVAGVVIYRRGGLGSPEFLSIAGSTNGRVRVVVDGMDYDEPELAWPHLYAIAVCDIERIALHRTSDPVRIEIWTRTAPETAPTVDFDLGRGDLGTRTRRMQFTTPEASVRVGLRYEELLQEEDDFRPAPETSPADLFGSYNGRNVAYAAEIRRGAESLQLVHERFNDNAHGSFESTADVTRALRSRDRVRWARPLGGGRLRLDLSNLAWDRDRTVNGVAQQVSESRRHAGVEVALRERGGWQGTIQAQARRIQGELVGVRRAQFGEYAGELLLERTGSLAASASFGAHRDERFGNAWSARARAGWTHGTWTLFVQGGRGVSFAGWDEPRSAGDDGQRIGQHVSAGLRRAGGRAGLDVDAFYKDLDGATRAAELFFPDFGTPPRQVAGMLARATWDDALASLQYGVDARFAWVPRALDQRQGIPRLESDVQAYLGRQDWFEGDLSVRIVGVFRAQTLREFDGFQLSSFATGDLVFNVLLLRRVQVFWTITNLIDERYALHPGVLDPGRRSVVGLQARFFD
jgi:hypothetical protein